MSIGSRLEFVSSNVGVLRHPDHASPACRSLNLSEAADAGNRSLPWTIDQSSFDELLHWLDPDPEVAGGKYEVIRHKLMTMFKYRGCGVADDLADETFDRVARRLPYVKPTFVGDPVRYFFGVARNVCKEYLRSVSRKSAPTCAALKEDEEDLLQRLDHALCRLSPDDRNLILEYYRDDGRSKTAHRKALAMQTGLRLEALRTRAYRIRAQLREYLETETAGHSCSSVADNAAAGQKVCTRTQNTVAPASVPASDNLQNAASIATSASHLRSLRRAAAALVARNTTRRYVSHNPPIQQ